MSYKAVVGTVVGLTITGTSDSTREYEFVGEFTIKRGNNRWYYDPDTSVMEIVGQATDLTQMPREHYMFHGDDDAVMGVLCYSHDNVAISFDCYHNGTNWISSDVGSNFALHKYGDKLQIGFARDETKGSACSLSYSGVSFTKEGFIEISRVCFVNSNQTPANDGAITPYGHVRVAGNGGAVVLDTDPAISNGTYDTEEIVIEGTSDTNTVEIADGCNTALAGGASMVLGQYDILRLRWNSSASLWVELSRSNN
jgi:hypothetical protein